MARLYTKRLHPIKHITHQLVNYSPIKVISNVFFFHISERIYKFIRPMIRMKYELFSYKYKRLQFVAGWPMANPCFQGLLPNLSPSNETWKISNSCFAKVH